VEREQGDEEIVLGKVRLHGLSMPSNHLIANYVLVRMKQAK
jgi:hypothetical protein